MGQLIYFYPRSNPEMRFESLIDRMNREANEAEDSGDFETARELNSLIAENERLEANESELEDRD